MTLEALGIAAGIVATVATVALALRSMWRAELAKARVEAASDQARDERIAATRSDVAELKAEVRADLAELATKIDHAVDLSQQSLRATAVLQGKIDAHTGVDRRILAALERRQARRSRSVGHRLASWLHSWHA